MVSEGEPVRVLIVDAQPSVRAWLPRVLGAEPRVRVVGEAGDAGRSIERALLLQPDVVVMDPRLPGGSGVEASRAIRSGHDGTRVLIHAAAGGDEALLAAVLAGAAGYVLKDLDAAPLVAAILAAAEARPLLARAAVEPAARRLMRLADRIAAPASIAGSPMDWRRVVANIVAGRSDGEIAASLGGSEEGVRRFAALLFEAAAGRAALDG